MVPALASWLPGKPAVDGYSRRMKDSPYLDLALEQVRREWFAAGRDLGGFHDNVSAWDTGDDDIAFWDEVEAREIKLRAWAKAQPAAPS